MNVPASARSAGYEVPLAYRVTLPCTGKAVGRQHMPASAANGSCRSCARQLATTPPVKLAGNAKQGRLQPPANPLLCAIPANPCPP